MPFMPRIVLAAFALFLSAGAAAQTFKCVNAAGKVTYTGAACAHLGLKDAGEVRDQLNVSPAQPVLPPQAAPDPAPAQDPARAPSGDARAGDAPATADPERRCFIVKTAKGTVTRCQDKPGE